MQGLQGRHGWEMGCRGTQGHEGAPMGCRGTREGHEGCEGTQGHACLTRGCLGSGAYSLTLQDLAVQALGLRALREISSGMVLVHHNPQLCFLQKVPWQSIFRNPRQRLFQTHNKPPKQCGKWGLIGMGRVGGPPPLLLTNPLVLMVPLLQRARGWFASTSVPRGTAGAPARPSAWPVSGSCVARSAWPPAISWMGECRPWGVTNGVPTHTAGWDQDPIPAPLPCRAIREHANGTRCLPCHPECQPQNGTETCFGSVRTGTHTGWGRGCPQTPGSLNPC